MQLQRRRRAGAFQLVLLSTFAGALWAQPAAAFDAIAFFEGSTQGQIECFGSWPGYDDQEGREGSARISTFSHEIFVPRDPQSGQASGRRVHQPMTLRLRLGKCSPKLYQALVTGEHLTQVEIKFFRPTFEGGAGEHYFTILLENALIVSMSALGVLQQDTFTESLISITYNTITWTWENGGVTATDTWGGP